MSLWVKRDRELKSNRKTYRLAELLSQGSRNLFGEGRDEVAWRAIACQVLEELWAYAFEHYPDGDVTNAPDAALRDAVQPFLTGTTWERADLRQLLLESGHLDRVEDRILIHGWFEWNGPEAIRMASDRSRKRLKRADTARKNARTRPQKKEGRGTGSFALTELNRTELNRTESQRQQPAAAPDEPEAQLRQRLPATYHEALDGYLKSAPFPPAVIQSILAEGPDTGINGAAGKTWDHIGQALLELRAAGEGFRPVLFRAYVTRLVRAAVDPAGAGLSTADRAKATLERMQREAEAGKP